MIHRDRETDGTKRRTPEKYDCVCKLRGYDLQVLAYAHTHDSLADDVHSRTRTKSASTES